MYMAIGRCSIKIGGKNLYKTHIYAIIYIIINVVLSTCLIP